MMSYLDEYTKKESKVFTETDSVRDCYEFIQRWNTLHNLESRDIKITIALVPTGKEIKRARDEEYFDEEYD